MNGQGHIVAITARQQFYCTKIKPVSACCNFRLFSTFHFLATCPIARVMQQAAFRVVQTIQQRISSSTEEKAATNTLKKIKCRH